MFTTLRATSWKEARYNLRNINLLYRRAYRFSRSSEQLCGESISSSEWSYSPYTFPVALHELPEFIFIGIPASESQNPLILPLAGHELGHVVWRRKGAKREFDPIIQAEILSLYRTNWRRFSEIFNIGLGPDKLETDLSLRNIWAQSYKLAQRQLEEVFCDFIGIYLFGQSFLHSFRYLVAPSLGYYRALNYPKLRDRARYMSYVARIYDLPQIANYEDSFSEQNYTMSPAETFIIEMSDAATENLHQQLPALLDKYRGRAGGFRAGTNDEPRVKKFLMSLVPAARVKSMASVVNAAWDIRLALDQWNVLTEIDEEDKRRAEKVRVLRDLVLKSFEVYEFRKRIAKQIRRSRERSRKGSNAT